MKFITIKNIFLFVLQKIIFFFAKITMYDVLNYNMSRKIIFDYFVLKNRCYNLLLNLSIDIYKQL